MTLPAFVAVESLTKVYRRGREDVHALHAVTFQIRRGEFLAMVGPSGSGKTTLLNLLGCMDTPSSGRIAINGREVQQFSEIERTRFRREEVGFVFQHFGLLPTLTVAENVSLPLVFSRGRRKGGIDDLLERVGLQHRRAHRPGELSGGEMQRVAIARALINQPELLLADEPTGNLDQAAGDGITELFQELNAAGLTLIVATHNPRLAGAAGRRIRLEDGRLVSQDPAGAAT